MLDEAGSGEHVIVLPHRVFVRRSSLTRLSDRDVAT